MKVYWNTCWRELGGTEESLSMKTITKSLFENFQKQVLFREIYGKYLEKTVHIVYSYVN